MRGRNGRTGIVFRTYDWQIFSKLGDGKGLLLGPNSPFKNIPILGMLL